MRRILEPVEDPHVVVAELMATLTSPPLFTDIDGVGALCLLWGDLSDIVDGFPVNYGPECEAIAEREFSRAAREWLRMSPTPAGLEAYIEGCTPRLASLQAAVEEIVRVADSFALGGGRSEDLPMVATRALALELDSPALRELAGLSRSDVREAADLFRQVTEEFSHPSQPVGLPAAREAACALLERRLAPPNGAAEIGEHLAAAARQDRQDLAEVAARFTALAEAWHDRPSDRARVVAEIKAEARLLLLRT
jgi:hypothetical protein